MTAITTRPPSDSAARAPNVAAGAAPEDSLLRFAMRADATLCAGAGLLIAMAADPLSRVSGLSSTAEWIGGAGLAAYGALLYVLAAAPDIRRVGISIVLGNIAFVGAVVVVVAANLLPLTEAGTVIALTTAAVTLGFAYLQYRGVRRLA